MKPKCSITDYATRQQNGIYDNSHNNAERSQFWTENVSQLKEFHKKMDINCKKLLYDTKI